MFISDYEKWVQIDRKLRELIRADDFFAFRAAFADAENLCKVASFRSYEVKRSSLLTMIVEDGNPEFLKKLLYFYFPADNEKNLQLKMEFLNGRSYTGKKMDYHYFHDDLPPELTVETDRAFGVLYQSAAYDASEKESAKAAEFYRLIKNEKIKLEQQLAPEDINELNRIRPIISPVSQRVAARLHTTVQDNETNSGLFFPELDFPPIVLRKIKYANGRDYISTVVAWSGGVRDVYEPLARRAYYQLEFPDEFADMVPVLRNLEKEYLSIENDDYLRSALHIFVNDGGLIRIEDKTDEKLKTNAFDDVVYNGYAGTDSQGDSVIAVNIQSTAKGVLTHETSHRADLSEQKETVDRPGGSDVYTSRTLSDNLLVDYVKSLIALSHTGEIREKIFRDITGYYPAGSHNSELLARIGEFSNIGLIAGKYAEAFGGVQYGYRYDHLLQSMYKLLGKYSEAKLNKNWAALHRIDTISSRLKHKSKLNELYQAVQPYLDEHSRYRERVSSLENALEKRSKVEKLVRSESWLPYMDAKDANRASVMENEIAGTIFNELRKINQINRCPAARCLKLPLPMLEAPTETAAEILWTEAQEECRLQEENQHPKRLRKLLKEIKVLATRNGSDRRRLNEKFIYLLGYGAQICNDFRRFCNREDNFKSSELTAVRAWEYADQLQLHLKYGVPYKDFVTAEKLGLSAKDFIRLKRESLQTFAKCSGFRAKAALLENQIAAAADAEGQMRLAAYAAALYGELFPDAKESFEYYDRASLQNICEKAVTFSQNLSLYLNPQKEDNITLEGVKLFGTDTNLPLYLSKATANLKKLELADFNCREIRDTDKNLHPYCLILFCALREIQKKHFPSAAMPPELRLDYFNDGTYNNMHIKKVVAATVKRFRQAGVFDTKGRIRETLPAAAEKANVLTCRCRDDQKQ